MNTRVEIIEPIKDRDYFPSIFANKDNTIIILADKRITDKTFSGMVIHSENMTKNATLGLYSTGWTYAQFTRLKKGSSVKINITQEEI